MLDKKESFFEFDAANVYYKNNIYPCGDLNCSGYTYDYLESDSLPIKCKKILYIYKKYSKFKLDISPEQTKYFADSIRNVKDELFELKNNDNLYVDNSLDSLDYFYISFKAKAIKSLIVNDPTKECTAAPCGFGYSKLIKNAIHEKLFILISIKNYFKLNDIDIKKLQFKHTKGKVFKYEQIRLIF